MNAVPDFTTAVRSLIGDVCWGVAVGGSTGSRFVLHLGDRVERARPVANEGLAEELRTHEGQHGLHVGCAAWRLAEDGRVITAWTDDAAVGGPLVAGLELLRGTVVTSASVTDLSHDLTVGFSRRYVLTVFCDQVEADLDNYTLWIDGVHYEVGARSVLSIVG